jgi:flagellar protein FlgJ
LDVASIQALRYVGQNEKNRFEDLSNRLLRENEKSRAVSSSNSTLQGKRSVRDKKLYGVCQDFEAIFIKQMLNAMRKTVDKSGLIDGGMAEEIFEDMLYDEYAKKMSRTARFGLAEILYDQLSNDYNKAGV